MKKNKLARRVFYITQDHAEKIKKTAKKCNATESEIVRNWLKSLLGK